MAKAPLEKSIFDQIIGCRLYGNICFWLGDLDEGKRMLDELLSMANETIYKDVSITFEKRQAANEWVNLNDIYR